MCTHIDHDQDEGEDNKIEQDEVTVSCIISVLV